MALIATIKAADNLKLYGILRKYNFGFAYNSFSSAFEQIMPANWYSLSSNNYAIANTKTVIASGVYAEYAFAMPVPGLAGGMPAGAYWLDVYTQASTNPAVTDGPPTYTIPDIIWNGSALTKISFDSNGFVLSDPMQWFQGALPTFPVTRPTQVIQRPTTVRD